MPIPCQHARSSSQQRVEHRCEALHVCEFSVIMVRATVSMPSRIVSRTAPDSAVSSRLSRRRTDRDKRETVVRVKRARLFSLTSTCPVTTWVRIGAQPISRPSLNGHPDGYVPCRPARFLVSLQQGLVT